jgi:predicted TIM-barrel fold metal-dependent hydrolase
VTIIDAHVHVGEWDHSDFLGRGASLDETLAVMAAAGVAGCAIMPTDRCDNAGLLAGARAAAAAGRGGALWFVAWVRPAADGEPGRADLDWVESQGRAVAGIKLHPSLSRRRVTDGAFAPALELAEARGLVVVVHCGRWQEMASYRFAVEAARRHRRARFLLAHAGGDTPPLATAAAELVRAERADNVWFDIAGLREYWVIERNAALLGADRYLLGSDYNLAHPAMYVGAVRGMRLAEADRERVLGGNALELFGEPLR